MILYNKDENNLPFYECDRDCEYSKNGKCQKEKINFIYYTNNEICQDLSKKNNNSI